VKRLLLLGGGHAHVHVLQALARQPLPSADVVLVSPYGRQIYSGMVPGMVAGHYRPEQCAIALQPLVQAAKARWVESAAVQLDAAAGQVLLATGERLPYDTVSLDTGSVMHRDRVPGAREHGLFVRPMEDFVRLVDRLLDLSQRKVLDVVVVGGGAGGVELALALAHRLGGARRAFKKPNAEDERARVALVTGGGEPLAGYPAAVVQHALAALARHRVTVFRDSCAAIEPSAVLLGSGARVACDAPVLATGAQAPSWLAGSGLALDKQGFVATGATLQSSSHPQVFAVGDVASRVDAPFDTAPHARSGVYAVRAGPPLAANLRLQLAGAALLPYRPQARTLNLISCGDRRAIVSWGGFSAQGRWAWWWKDHIDRAFVARYGATATAPTVLASSAPAEGPAPAARARPES
jgi:pyridine nucleotide-disulfide oxidoreductase family protein